jgi:two-component sensor histidine kinase
MDDAETFLRSVCHTIADVLDATWSSVITLDLEHERVRANVMAEKSTPLAPVAGFEEAMDGLTGWCVRNREPTRSPGTRPDPREGDTAREKRRKNQIGSVMVAPLIHQGSVLGTVTAGRLVGEEEFDGEDLDLLDTMAHQAAIAVHTHDLYEEQRRKARERKFLLKEINHRVKNNLNVIISLARLHKQQLQDETLGQPFDDLIRRVYSMALLHEKLWDTESLGEISAKDYLEDLAGHLSTVVNGTDTRARITISAQPVRLDLDTLMPLGLVASELITNALQHAFPGSYTRGAEAEPTITITFSAHHEVCALEVADNGIGIDEEDVGFERGEFGLSLARSLAAQIRGELTRLPESGTRWRLSFPRPNE